MRILCARYCSTLSDAKVDKTARFLFLMAPVFRLTTYVTRVTFLKVKGQDGV